VASIALVGGSSSGVVLDNVPHVHQKRTFDTILPAGLYQET